MIDQKAAESFWRVVEECLVKFHDWDSSQAAKKSWELRRRIEVPEWKSPIKPEEYLSDIVHHAEPFDIACDLAEKPLDLDQ
jgi:hypothetical protein